VLAIQSSSTSDGSLDPTFHTGTGANSWVNVVLEQPAAKLLIGGFFTTVAGQNFRYVARLQTDGVQDASFKVGTGFNGTIQSLIRCADGTMVAGGLFTSYNGVTANRIVRLLASAGGSDPRLGFATSGSALTLQWPATYGNYQLQATPALGTALTNLNTILATNGADISATILQPGHAFFQTHEVTRGQS
jgi:hypothetical protein